jgi:phenylacetate-CoA ligase
VRGHEVLPHDLHVEVLDKEGNVCDPGVRGEITLTGGRNPFLPLLRYRTGDWASLNFDGAVPVLVGLEGRAPVVFRARGGQLVNNIDVTQVLQQLALPQFTLHQSADGALTFRARGTDMSHEALREALLGLFGPDQPLSIEDLPEQAGGDKVIPYTSDWTA